jgi:hypothetical protein
VYLCTARMVVDGRLDGQILHGVAVPAPRLLAAGSGEDRRWAWTIQRKPDALRLRWRGVFCRVLLYEAWPVRIGSRRYCIYGTAWTWKWMMYCVLTLPGKAAHGAWPATAAVHRIRSSDSTRSPTALRGRYRRRVPVDGRATAHTVRSACLPSRAGPTASPLAPRPSPLAPRPSPIAHPPASNRARARWMSARQPTRRPGTARGPLTSRAGDRLADPSSAPLRSAAPLPDSASLLPAVLASARGGVGDRELSIRRGRGRDRRDGAMLLWAGPRRAAQLFRVQSWRNPPRPPSIPSPLPCRPLRAASTRPRLHPFPMAEGRGGERP